MEEKLKHKLVLFVGCLLLGATAQAQTIPFSGQFQFNTYRFRGTMVGPWGSPDNAPIVGGGAYCGVGQPAIGATLGPWTSCSNTVTITANGGKDPTAWVLYTSGYNWEPYYQIQTRAWYYWTSCDVGGALRRTYDNPTGTQDGTYVPESC